VIEDFHGVEFDALLRRTREYVEIVRAYLAGERVEYDSEQFDLSGFALDVDRTYDCPIYVVSMGEVTRQLTGEFADGWIPLLIPNTAVEERLEAVERGPNAAVARERRRRTLYTDLHLRQRLRGGRRVRPVDDRVLRGRDGRVSPEMVVGFGFEEEAETIQNGLEEDTRTGAENTVTDERVSTVGACGTPEQAATSFEPFVDGVPTRPLHTCPASGLPTTSLARR